MLANLGSWKLAWNQPATGGATAAAVGTSSSASPLLPLPLVPKPDEVLSFSGVWEREAGYENALDQLALQEKLSWLNRRIISAVWRRLSLTHSNQGGEAHLVLGWAPIWAVRFGWKVNFEFSLGNGKFSEWKLFRWMRSGVFSNKTLKLRGMYQGNSVVLQMCQIADDGNGPDSNGAEMDVIDVTKEEHPSFISSVGGSIANRFEVLQQFTGM
jgi:hypothetical protein